MKIGKSAFSGRTSITSISFPNSIQKLGNNILPCSFIFNNSSLKNIQIENVICNFNKRLVFGKKYLCSIEIPNSVELINNLKYSYNTFSNFIIPNTVVYITKYAFYNCSALISILIPHGVIKIGKCAFSGCSSLTDIKIPYSVKKIGKCAFAGCSSLKNISIPSSVKTIGDRAFMNCLSLPKSFSIQFSVKKVGSDIFLIKNSAFFNGFYGLY